MSDTGFQAFPWPHDLKEFEVDDAPNVFQRPRKHGTYIEGDELALMMSTIATELYDRGQHDLAEDVRQFVGSIGG